MSDWYPSSHQLSTPAESERTVRRVLEIVYGVRDSHKEAAKPQAPSAVPNGPANTQVCGLPVLPIDPTRQPLGSVMTYNPKNRRMEFTTPAGAVPTPATAASPGTPGQISFDATHVYVCVATNTWVRATLATF